MLVENEWVRICLGWYLQGPGFLGRAAEDGAPRVARGVAGVESRWPRGRGAVLVLGRQPRQRSLRRWARRFPDVVRFPRTGCRVVALDPGRRGASPGAAAAGPGPAVGAEDVPGERLLAALERLRWPAGGGGR